MKSVQNQEHKKQRPTADDEIGQPIWKIPKTDEVDQDKENEEEDDEVGEIRPIPRSKDGMEIHAPGFDPLQQQEWEEREKLRRQKKEEDERRENPRGIWKMS